MKRKFIYLILIISLLILPFACKSIKVDKSGEKDCIDEPTDIGLPTTPSVDPTCGCEIPPTPTPTTPTPIQMDLVYVEYISADDNEDCARGNFNIRAKELGYNTIQYPDTSQYYIYTNPSKCSIKLSIKLGSTDPKLAKQVEKIKFRLDCWNGINKDFKIRDAAGNIISYSYYGDDTLYYDFILDWIPDDSHPECTAIWLMDIWSLNDTWETEGIYSNKKVFWICDFKLKGHTKWQSEEWFDNGHDSYGPGRNDMFYLFNIYNDFYWSNIRYDEEKYSWRIRINDKYIKELNMYVSEGCIVDRKINPDENGIYTLYSNPEYVDFKVEFIYQFNDEYYLWKFDPKFEIYEIVIYAEEQEIEIG